MTKEPLVSYVVVTHNREPKLVQDRIIQSIKNQAYPHKELILVGEQCLYLDEIAVGLHDSPEFEHFEYFNIEKPEEALCIWALVARARNAGIARARGDYICCQDDDNELVPEFTIEMITLMEKNKAKAAWCWRKALEEDGTLFSGNYFPWISDDDARRSILYNIWVNAGVLEPGSAVIKDNLWAARGAERFSTVDPNEWLVHKDVFKLVPYRERYTHNEICYHITFDDIWDEEFSRSALPVVCWQHPGLIYYLGGASNSRPTTAQP
ncbi:MAG: glycosyltransferase family A protein [Chlorobium sp.]